MYIAYSSLSPATAGAQLTETEQNQTLSHELHLRYQAYQAICNKYRREITAIQQYLPGWQPEFR